MSTAPVLDPVAGKATARQRLLALMALGFKQIEAHDTVRRAQVTLGPQATIEELVRACLKKAA